MVWWYEARSTEKDGRSPRLLFLVLPRCTCKRSLFAPPKTRAGRKGNAIRAAFRHSTTSMIPSGLYRPLSENPSFGLRTIFRTADPVIAQSFPPLPPPVPVVAAADYGDCAANIPQCRLIRPKQLLDPPPPAIRSFSHHSGPSTHTHTPLTTRRSLLPYIILLTANFLSLTHQTSAYLPHNP